MSHGCGFAAKDSLVSMTSRVSTEKGVGFETSGVRHEVQGDDVLHVTFVRLHQPSPSHGSLHVSGSLQSPQGS